MAFQMTFDLHTLAITPSEVVLPAMQPTSFELSVTNNSQPVNPRDILYVGVFLKNPNTGDISSTTAIHNISLGKWVFILNTEMLDTWREEPLTIYFQTRSSFYGKKTSNEVSFKIGTQPPVMSSSTLAGLTRYATTAEAHDGAAVDAAVTPPSLLMRKKANGAIIGGTFHNWSGPGVINAKSLQITSDGHNWYSLGERATAVGGWHPSAAGLEAVALGTQANASGIGNVAVGHASALGGQNATALGSAAAATGNQSVAIGYNSDALANGATALGGEKAKASATFATAIGSNTQSHTPYVAEIGGHPTLANRGAAVRAHGLTGMVAMTIQDRNTPYTASASAKGAEADNTLAAGMFSIRRDGDDILIDINIAGTIKTLNLGTAI